MKKVEKEKQRNNFTKLTHKGGISLIVLIVTIIVIIILAAAVILAISNNNPIGSAKEATFKEDVRGMQDELSLYLSKKYTNDSMNFNKEEINLESDKMVEELPSTKKYKDKVKVEKGELVWIGNTDTEEYEWFKELSGDVSSGNDSNIKNEWKDTIASVKEGVPIPKGFTYKEGTKDTGLVIQDKKGNEFVWVPATESTYANDFDLSGGYIATSSNTQESKLPNGIINETADVVKYGGFYIGRYEAGVPDSQSTIDGTSSSTSNVTDVPVSKKGSTVWTNIDYNNSKASAESMISNEYVQTGLITGKAWDTTCHWIEDSLSSINASASLKDSRYYGNYNDSIVPAVENSRARRTAGFSESWKTKNIYDLAGNMEERTSEVYSNNYSVIRGGCCFNSGVGNPVSYRGGDYFKYAYDYRGFRVRLYIK